MTDPFWLREPSVTFRRDNLAPAGSVYSARPCHPSLSADFRRIPYPATGHEDEPYFAGYMGSISVTHGARLIAHVASRSTAPFFVDIYRVTGCADPQLAPRLLFVHRYGSFDPHTLPPLQDGRRLSSGEADSTGCGWPAIELGIIPPEWPSGVYLAQFSSLPAPTGSCASRAGQDSLFILRAAQPRSPFLCQVGVATWAAYHMWHNQTLYAGRTNRGERWDELRAGQASLQRPALGLCLPNETILTPAPPKATYIFAFIDWLERENIAMDFCSGLDLADDGVDLGNYRAVITVGHDEYWTAEQQRLLCQYRESGGHTVFFGGNLAYWQIRSAPDHSSIECYKHSEVAVRNDSPHDEFLDPLAGLDPSVDRLTGQSWIVRSRSTIPTTGVYNFVRRPNAPEQVLTAGAMWWWEELGGPSRPARGFTICDPDHWAFHGLDLKSGDIVGLDTKLVGHEADGLEIVVNDGQPTLTFDDGALPGTQLLAYADCRDWGAWDFAGWPPLFREGASQSPAGLGGFVTMIHRHVRGEGMLFCAPTTEWVFGLLPTMDWTSTRMLDAPVLPADPAVEQITRNVLNACLQEKQV